MATILPFNDPGKKKCCKFLEVCTYRKPKDSRVILANINHVFTGARGATWLKIVIAKPMGHNAAMAHALDYAKKHDVRVIYENRAT